MESKQDRYAQNEQRLWERYCANLDKWDREDHSKEENEFVECFKRAQQDLMGYLCEKLADRLNPSEKTGEPFLDSISDLDCKSDRNDYNYY